MPSKPVILVIEDDKSIRNFIKISLETQGYKVIETSDGKNGIALTLSHNPDVIIMDLGLPDLDGLQVIQRIRPVTRAAIIVVSARGLDRDKIEVLDMGADDYLTKPFSVAELLARIRVALRHQSHGGSPEVAEQTSFDVADLKIDFDRHRVTISGEEVHLTPIEFKLLELLAKHPGKVLTHKSIIKEIWGASSESDTQSLRVFMANIRRKIETNSAQPRYLLTEVGVGYRLVDE